MGLQAREWPWVMTKGANGGHTAKGCLDPRGEESNGISAMAVERARQELTATTSLLPLVKVAEKEMGNLRFPLATTIIVDDNPDDDDLNWWPCDAVHEEGVFSRAKMRRMGRTPSVAAGDGFGSGFRLLQRCGLRFVVAGRVEAESWLWVTEVSVYGFPSLRGEDDLSAAYANSFFPAPLVFLSHPRPTSANKQNEKRALGLGRNKTKRELGQSILIRNAPPNCTAAPLLRCRVLTPSLRVTDSRTQFLVFMDRFSRINYGGDSKSLFKLVFLFWIVVVPSRFSVATMVTTSEDGFVYENWFLDTGCSNHMTGHKIWISNLDTRKTSMIRLRNDKTMKVVGVRNIVIKKQDEEERLDDESNGNRQADDGVVTMVEEMRAIETIRLVVALANGKRWPLFQLDVKFAFLNVPLEEEVYVTQPPGFEIKCYENNGYRLRKALYGLKQAPKAWNKVMDSFMLKHKFLKCLVEHGVYVRFQDDANLLLICTYVDDLLIIGSNILEIEKFKGLLMAKFEMTYLNKFRYFIRLEFVKSSSGIISHQRKYATKILKKFNMEICNAATTSTVANITDSDNNEEEVDNTPYKQMVSSPK
ncbi:hypothetical protein V8G54_012536 [Vigna mungo]|uniref:Reverse transcriptase Ty1/copia-type domain-containing protein n=1 Tax=Vigna mungo TaxID=3915 RepID=A0AAQ3NRC7_VIGMU